jgi:parallel beta-helix repeat protein
VTTTSVSINPKSKWQNIQPATLVFIDSRVDDWQVLAAGVREDVKVTILDSDTDGIKAMTAGLQNFASSHGLINAVHIVSHGNFGSLELGNTVLDSNTLSQYSSCWQQWRNLLAEEANILLYGCRVAGGDGATFVRQLSQLTGAKIAASADLIGGGNWNLEFTTGPIKAPPAFKPEVMAGYSGVLAILTVTNNADGGAGSLRQAIASAAAGDTIQFASSLANQTITLTSGQLNVTKNLIIDGAAAAGLTISGNNASRVFYCDAFTTVSLNNLTIANGKLSGTSESDEANSAGAGILTGFQNTLTLENCRIDNNVAGYSAGLCAGNRSTTTVINSKFNANDGSFAPNTERGGGAIGVKSGSTITVRDSEFTNNTGTYGGAINNLLSGLTVENTRFVNNSTKDGVGGAIYVDGASELTNDSIGGTIAIRNSWFEGNIGTREGGAAFLFGYPPDTLVLENSTFINNQAIKNAQGNGGSGGGVRAGNGDLTVTNCTFANNTAQDHGGGLWVGEKGNVTITNSTFSGNTAQQQGGAITIANNNTVSTLITNTTFANNSAAGYAGAIASFGTQPITVKNSIFSKNTAGNPFQNRQNTSREFIDGGKNIQWPDKLIAADNYVTANITIADPKIGPLQNNGGPTFTHALLAGSPAINAGVAGETLDQRGVTRVNPDIGAFEQFQVQFTSTASNANEPATGSAIENIQVQLSQPVGFDVTVPYAVTGGTAISGTDFTPPTGTIIIPAGTTTVNIPLQILADSLTEPAETVQLGLTAPTASTYVLGANTAHTHTINANSALNQPPSFTSSAVIAATEDIAYTYNISTTDPDTGDTLTISAPTLPAWLTFTDSGNGTGTLTGTPTNAQVGSYNVVLRVSDGTANVDQNFTIAVANVNDAPTVASPIPDTTAAEDTAFNFTIPASTFSDVDVGDTLTYSATLANGSPLPSWLTFNAATGTFTGTPTNSDVGILSIAVRATDTAGAFVSDTFNLAVANTNDAPALVTPIPDRTSAQDTAFTFLLPVSTFSDVDAGDTLTYSATLANGSPLPSWLTFDAITGTFTGTPTNSNVGTISLQLTATDNAGASASDLFNLTVTAPTPTSGEYCLCEQFPTPDFSTGSATPNPVAQTINGTEGNDTLNGTEVGEAINGLGGNDTLAGNGGNDNLDGGSGNDLIYGNQGADFANGNIGNDTIYGGKDNDTLLGGADNDILLGDLGNDTLIGGDGNDLLFGNTGADFIGGSLGDDTIYGGMDSDILKGGAGNDIVLGDIGNDTICGGDGADLLFGNTGADLIDGCAGNDTINAGKDNDTLMGNTGNDILYGDAGNDFVYGNAGADTLNGGDGNDTLNGGKDNDILTGGSGDDLLNGDFGNDTLTGGGNLDTFVLTQGYGSDIILDFQNGEDLLGLAGGLTFSQLTITQSSGATLISIASSGELLASLQGVQSNLIGVEDFTLI